jgi:hypothetical protein
MEGFNVEDILDKSKYKVIVQKTLKDFCPDLIKLPKNTQNGIKSIFINSFEDFVEQNNAILNESMIFRVNKVLVEQLDMFKKKIAIYMWEVLDHLKNELIKILNSWVA